MRCTATGLAANASLRTHRLTSNTTITTLTRSLRVEGWQVIDLLESEKRRMSEEELLSLLRPLAPRYYSIASSRKAVPDEAHLLIASVRYPAHGRCARVSPRWTLPSGESPATGCLCS